MGTEMGRDGVGVEDVDGNRDGDGDGNGVEMGMWIERASPLSYIISYWEGMGMEARIRIEIRIRGGNGDGDRERERDLPEPQIQTMHSFQTHKMCFLNLSTYIMDHKESIEKFQ